MTNILSGPFKTTFTLGQCASLASQIPNAKLRLCLCLSLGFSTSLRTVKKLGQLALVDFQDPDNFKHCKCLQGITGYLQGY